MKQLVLLIGLTFILAGCDKPDTQVEKTDLIDEAAFARIASLQQELSQLLAQANQGLTTWRNLVITSEITQSDLAQDQSVELLKFTTIDISELDEDELKETIHAIAPVLLEMKVNISLIEKWYSTRQQSLSLKGRYALQLKQSEINQESVAEDWWQQAFEQEQAEDFLGAYQLYVKLNGEYTRKIQMLNGALASKVVAQKQQGIWKEIAAQAKWLRKQDQIAQQEYFQAVTALGRYNYEKALAQFDRSAQAWSKLYQTGLLGISTPSMVAVKGGKFVMGDQMGNGDSDEKPTYQAQVLDFKMSQNEITFTQYDNYAKSEGLPLPDDNGWGRGNRPVINISWLEAMKFATWLSEKSGKVYRLPTEEEWEYAAKANENEDPFASGVNVGNLANCEGCYKWDNTQSTPVGQFPENQFGLHDMRGNVWEWTADCYRPSYVSTEKAVEECDEKSVRGGSWYDLPTQLRASNRSKANAMNGSNRIGFRLVEVKPTSTQTAQSE